MDASSINDDFQVRSSLRNVKSLVVKNMSLCSINSGWYNVLSTTSNQAGIQNNFWIVTLDVNAIKKVILKFKRVTGSSITLTLSASSTGAPIPVTYDSFQLPQIPSAIYDITEYYKDYIRFIQGQIGPNEYSSRVDIAIGNNNFCQLLIMAYIDTEINFTGLYDNISPL